VAECSSLTIVGVAVVAIEKSSAARNNESCRLELQLVKGLLYTIIMEVEIVY
jgi:hypothetical protein